jgi:hypothetical protein
LKLQPFEWEPASGPVRARLYLDGRQPYRERIARMIRHPKGGAIGNTPGIVEHTCLDVAKGDSCIGGV